MFMNGDAKYLIGDDYCGK